MPIDFSDTFDTTNVLAGMFLWIIFNYLSVLLNCDLQKLLASHPVWIHLFGLTAFFFLFTLLDSNNKSTIGIIWLKTIFVYLLFILMIKSKWYFVIPVLILLLLDQTLKKHVALQEAKEKDTASLKPLKETQNLVTRILNAFIVVIILIGSMHYLYLQYKQHGKAFNLYTFFFGVKHCIQMQK